jgi:hypothetical protein
MAVQEHQAVIQVHQNFMQAVAEDQLKTHQRFLATAVQVSVEMVERVTMLLHQHQERPTQVAVVVGLGLESIQAREVLES